ncbi:hypothetical protein ID866_6527 [Astraeus odoratus]|nr:hypothetical protein ID866_6527 [Astraeus odoratus]
MATQPPYSLPGPSNYYPPPPYAYGSHSPAPPSGPAPYPYQYSVSPTNGQGHPAHSPSPPRVNSHGRGYPPRGGSNYQNYHPHHHPHYHHHHSPSHRYPYPPRSPHHPPPSHQPQNKYPTHAQTPPHVAYSPNYAIHSSTTYTPPVWQPQQPLSPLPKQLSMLSSLPPGPPQPSRSPQQDDTPASPNAEILKPDTDTPPMDEIAKPNSEEPVDISSADAPQKPATPTPTAMSHSSHSLIARSHTPPNTDSSSTSSPPSVTASPDSISNQPIPVHASEYVIWSRRPTNPSSAPGVIISPRACPPQYIRQKAVGLPSPSPSPLLAEEGQHQAPAPAALPADVSSSLATEATTATPSAAGTSVPASPVSSNTPLSVAISPSADEMIKDSESLRAATPQPEPAALPPDQTVEDRSSKEESPSSPAHKPSADPKPAAPRPSFASLFRQESAKPNALPRSSVIGFSVPASAVPSTSIIVPTKKPELLSLLTSGPSSQPTMRIRPRGLVNTGNMCFANAVLQVLVYCSPFWRLFHELGKFVDGPEEGAMDASKTPLVDATVRFLQEFVPKQKATAGGKGKGVDTAYNGYNEDEDIVDSFIPTYVYDALKEKKRFDHMRGGHQEDAEEFLGFYLDTLEEELLSITSSLQQKTADSEVHPEGRNGDAVAEDGPWLEVGKRNRSAVTRTAKTTESPITRIFGGKFRSTLRVPHQKDSIIYEDWRSLQLDIQRDQIHSIKDALSYISAPQSVQVTSVTRPGAILDATQTVHIESLPPILILHLKRFLYDVTAGGVAKVGKQVSFAPELEVGSDIMAPGRKLHLTKYKLFGALYHHGHSASGGHYTLDVLHPNIDLSPTKPREGWIRIDDELVSDVRPEDVFSPSENAESNRCAYLLFYRRVSGGVGRT